MDMLQSKEELQLQLWSRTLLQANPTS